MSSTAARASWSAILEVAAGIQGEADFGFAEVPISVQFAGQDHDFGELTLATPAQLASGRIRDPEGNPVDAHVYVYEAQYSPIGQVTEPHFRWAPGSTSRVDADGSFHSIGVSSAPQLRLEIEAEGFLEQEILIDRGADDVDVVLHQDLGIRGRLVIPAGFLAGDFYLRFHPGILPEEFDYLPGPNTQATPDETGAFRISGLASDAPGTLLAVHRDSGVVLAQVDGIAPARSEAPGDPRLDPLQLPELHHYRLEVFGPSGGKGPTYSWDLVAPEIHVLKTYWYSAGSAREMVVASPSITVGILANGYLYQEVQLTPGENEVRLERAPLVQFLAPDLPKLPEGLRYSVDLEALDGPDLLDQSGSLPAGIGGGVFPVPMSASGRYTVQLSLWDHEHGIGVDITEAGEPWQFEFTIAEEAAGQQIEVPIPVDAIQRAIEDAQAQAAAQGD